MEKNEEQIIDWCHQIIQVVIGDTIPAMTYHERQRKAARILLMAAYNYLIDDEETADRNVILAMGQSINADFSELANQILGIGKDHGQHSAQADS